jgi:ubiquinone/menaquinone biosynthesis C-methylase UbiE
LGEQAALVIIGVGGLGISIAKRIGAGRRLLLADYSGASLDAAAEKLKNDGYVAEVAWVDIAGTN